MDSLHVNGGRWDCHTHIYGPWKDFPLPEGAVYRPAAAPMAALLEMHRKLGISHGVLVQAACYGTDHSALLDAIAGTGGRYKGVALLNGLFWGSIMGALTWLMYDNLQLGGVMMLAMLLNLLLAALMGVLIPLLMTKMKRDPAVGSSVLITALTDTGGFFIFLGLATIFLLPH